MEFDLLKTFIEHPNKVPDTRSAADLDAQPRMGAIRPLDRHPYRSPAAQVEVDPDNPLAIQTIRGAGYMFVPPAG